MGPLDKLRLKVAGRGAVDDAVDRRLVTDFLADLRRVCGEEGPWAFGRYLEMGDDPEPRQVAYLLLWKWGPEAKIWEVLQRFDAVDLAIDAAAEGFEMYLAERAEA